MLWKHLREALRQLVSTFELDFGERVQRQGQQTILGRVEYRVLVLLKEEVLALVEIEFEWE
jgi:hypothetical protein